MSRAGSKYIANAPDPRAAPNVAVRAMQSLLRGLVKPL
jgi:hypothetical protein